MNPSVPWVMCYHQSAESSKSGADPQQHDPLVPCSGQSQWWCTSTVPAWNCLGSRFRIGVKLKFWDSCISMKQLKHLQWNSWAKENIFHSYSMSIWIILLFLFWNYFYSLDTLSLVSSHLGVVGIHYNPKQTSFFFMHCKTVSDYLVHKHMWINESAYSFSKFASYFFYPTQF